MKNTFLNKLVKKVTNFLSKNAAYIPGWILLFGFAFGFLIGNIILMTK